MSNSTLLALAERVEREEPSGLLDADIAVALRIGPASVTLDHWIYRNFPNWKARTDGRVEAGMHWAPLPYTTSLDAAVMLVPDGWCWDAAGHSEGGNAWVMDESDGCEHVPCFRARTPALALCAAALRARAAMEA